MLYVSFHRLSPDWEEDAPCPVAPELVIEIVCAGQMFGAIATKATDYLTAGVLRVWVVDPRDRSIAVFQPDSTPRIDREGVVLTDAALPELELAVGELF